MNIPNTSEVSAEQTVSKPQVESGKETPKNSIKYFKIAGLVAIGVVVIAFVLRSQPAQIDYDVQLTESKAKEQEHLSEITRHTKKVEIEEKRQELLILEKQLHD